MYSFLYDFWVLHSIQKSLSYCEIRKVISWVFLFLVLIFLVLDTFFFFFTIKSLIHLQVNLVLGEARIPPSFFQMHEGNLRKIKFNFWDFYNLLVVQNLFFAQCVAFLIQLVISNKYLFLRARTYLAYLLNDQGIPALTYERGTLGGPKGEDPVKSCVQVLDP